MDDFEEMLHAERISVERFVRYRLPSREDADDVLQEIYLTAYQKFPQLKNKASFKAWLLAIARNKCNDYFRRKAAQLEIPVDELTETILSDSRQGLLEGNATSRNRQKAKYPCGNRKKQTSHGKAELQKQISISHWLHVSQHWDERRI